MTDHEHRKLLRAIHDLAIVPYPYADGSNNDPILVLALGQVIGIASRALDEHARKKWTGIAP